MKGQWLILGLGIVLIGLMAGGCATGSTEHAAGQASALSTNPGDQAFHFRNQAVELREMAKRLEMEANYYASQGGQDQERVKRNRELAAQMLKAADEAEQRAREYREQLPHNQVY